MIRNCMKVLKLSRPGCSHTKPVRYFETTSRNLSSFYDPPYLDALKPQIEYCKPFNIQLIGPDLALVESSQRVVHSITKMMDIDVSDSWGTPAKKSKIQKFKPLSDVVDSEYVLTYYERNIQIVDLPNNLAPVLIELAQAGLPPTVTMNVNEHTDEDETDRYVPDLELKQLKDELDAAGGPIKKK